MQKLQEFEAQISYSHGRISTNPDLVNSLGIEAPFKADDNGVFSGVGGRDDITATVETVGYLADKKERVSYFDAEHKFTFKEFVEMGRPHAIKVTKKFSYENLDKANSDSK